MSFGWVICIVLGGIAGVLDAREKITGRPVRLRFKRLRRRPALDDPAAAAGAGANSAIGSAWASAAARRWLAVYGAELGALDGFAKIGGLSCFRCPAQNYLSISEAVSKETVTGAPDRAAQMLSALFLRLSFVQDGPEARTAGGADIIDDMPADDTPASEDITDGWDNDFYRDQTRAAWASGVDLEEPQTLLEVVANAFSGKKHFLDRTDFERETGYKSELARFNYFWAKSGGLSLVAWSEQIASDYSYAGLVPMLPDFSGYDIQAVRDAVIELFAICSRPSDISEFTKNENKKRLEDLDGLF